ncbi:MAG TPA: helix-turn-helix domain-containing protein, partial [Rubrobacter sp.]|nr:helix-turn-helix domain-containing protein [Rubrobacter sp.]
MTFGATLRELRDAAGLTQEELASRAGLTAKAVSALERGERKRPYPHTVRALSDALNLSDQERSSLFAAVPNRNPEPPPPALHEEQEQPTQMPSAPPSPMLLAAMASAPHTSLVGRERELSEIERFLSEVRLLTLTGTGGVGKTRLAIEAARRLEDLFPDGVAFVGLAPLGDASLVIPTIAQTLGLREIEGMNAKEA